MAETSLSELTAIAAAAAEPGFTPTIGTKPGGIDPLGMRQINFDLMDQVFPDLNNVTRHIRPFVVITWAWRRANQLAQNQGKPQMTSTCYWISSIVLTLSTSGRNSCAIRRQIFPANECLLASCGRMNGNLVAWHGAIVDECGAIRLR